MAVLYITEFAAQSRDARGAQMRVPDEPPAAEQTVAISAGSLQSSALNALTKFVRVHADAICSIAIGTNPTATATTRRLAAGSSEYFGVPLNGGFKVAVITNT
jgi:hypothetical protein